MQNLLINIIKKSKVKAIIFDFDNTITTKDSSTSIGVFNNCFDENYKIKKSYLDIKATKSNRESLSKIWFEKIQLLKQYYNEDILPIVEKEFVIRKSFYVIYKYCLANNIDIFICSSGFKTLIEYLLEKNNINNYVLFANDFDTKYEKIITPYNKYIVTNKIANYNIVVVNEISDLSMCNSNTILKIGINISIYDKENNFDYILDDL